LHALQAGGTLPPVIVDGYVRVSQVAGREGGSFISPQVQRELIEGWTKLHRVELGRVFEELDESGGRPDRPLLMEAIARVEAGQSRGIVVAKLDRFGRSLSHGLAAIERITKAGGKLVSVDDGFDFGTDTGRLVLRIMLSMAEWELDRVRANWRAADERAVARGVYFGTVPFGYTRKNGQLVADPSTAPYVREAFERRAAGATVSEIERFLTGRVPTATGRVQWHSATVGALLARRTYLGEIRRGEFVKFDAHEALVDPATWQAAQRPRIRPPTPYGQRPALLRGLLRCAGCSRPLTSQVAKDMPNRGVRRYCCFRRRGAEPCPTPAHINDSLIEPYIEALFWQELDKLASGHASLRRLADLEERVERCEQALVSYRDSPRIAATLDVAHFADGLAVRQARLDAALVAVHRFRERTQPPDLPEADVLKENWAQLDIPSRREALGKVFSTIFVKRGRGHVEDRTFACLMGDGPAESATGRAAPRMLSVVPFKAEGRPRVVLSEASDPLWPVARLHAELSAFVNTKSHWPGFHEFQDAGLGLLYRQMTRHGGVRRWSRELNLPRVGETFRPLWPDERIRRDLREFLAGRTVWPGQQEFRAAGKRRLREAVTASGGPERWAAEFGLTLTQWQHAERFWSDDRVERELRELTAGRRDWPSRREFIDAGKLQLYACVQRRGERMRWANRLGLEATERRRRSSPVWTDEVICQTIRALSGDTGVFPRMKVFKDAGIESLYQKLRKSDLGLRGWANRLRLEFPSAANAWTDDRIERRLRAVIGAGTAWPSVSDFQRAGEYNLYRAVRRSPLGPSGWAARLRVGPPRVTKWTPGAIAGVLADLLAARDGWPTAREFDEMGLRGMYTAMCRSEIGAAGWAARFGRSIAFQRQTKDQLRERLRAFVGDRTEWPSYTEFHATPDGRKLYSAVIRRGGLVHWADDLGLEYRRTWRNGPRTYEKAHDAVGGAASA
jgi:DNA invertase Pin-like site-specific DNA recombinase